MKKIIPTVILAGAASALPLSAIDVYEGFDYTAGDLTNGNATGIGWDTTNAGWKGNSGLTFNGQSGADVVSKTWTVPTNYGFTPTTGALQNDTAQSNVPYRGLDGSNTIDLDTTNTYYFSFLVNNPTNSGGNFNIGFGDANSGSGSAVGGAYLGIQLAAGGGGDAVQLGNRNGTGGKDFGFAPGVLTYGQDFLVVGRISTFAAADATNDQIQLNVYSSTGSVPTVDPGTFTYSNFGQAIEQTGVIDRITIGASATGNDFSGVNPADLIFDEFRMGDSWGAVVVPEPSSYGLIAGALALGSIMIRRRK